METPGILSIRHGVFSWGATITQDLDNAEIIEYIAEICILTKTLNPNSETIENNRHERWYKKLYNLDVNYI